MQSHLRKHLLEQLQHEPTFPAVISTRPSSLREHVLDTIVAEYLAASQRTRTLSVFLPEAALEQGTPLTHADILAALQISPSSPLHAALSSALTPERFSNGVHLLAQVLPARTWLLSHFLLQYT